MRVGELERILERLPDDMEVHIAAGRGCCHIDTVDKRPRRRWKDWGIRWPHRMGETVTERFDGDDYIAPPALHLEGRTLWFLREPPWRAVGRWPGGTPTAETIFDEPPE